MTYYFKATAILITVWILMSFVASAQELEVKRPELNNHVFIPTNTIPTPFINTYFNSNLGVGASLKFQYPLFEINGETVFGVRGNILFANLGFQYQQRVRDWIAFYSRITLNTRLGTNVQSMLFMGVNTVTAMKLGWLIKLSEGKKHTLSTNIDLNNYSGSFINVGDFVKDIINNNPYPSLTKLVPALSIGTGLRFGYGFNEVVGFRCVGDITYGEAFDRTRTDFKYALSGSFDFNFYRKYDIPVGIVLGYTNITKSEVVYVDNGSAHITNFKIAYTGTTDFDIGIETSIMAIPFKDLTDKPKVVLSILMMRYYFN